MLRIGYDITDGGLRLSVSINWWRKLPPILEVYTVRLLGFAYRSKALPSWQEKCGDRLAKMELILKPQMAVSALERNAIMN